MHADHRSGQTYEIHTYPTRLIMPLQLAKGCSATLRPVLPQDAPLEQDFIAGLSPQARRQRFHAAISGLSKALVHSLTHIDYVERMGFVVTVQQDGAERVIADACYAVIDDGDTAEFAIAVADDWRGLGLGRHLMTAIERAARHAGLRWLYGEVLSDNRSMLALMTRLGFQANALARDAGLLRVERLVTPLPRPQGRGVDGSSPWQRLLADWLPRHPARRAVGPTSLRAVSSAAPGGPAAAPDSHPEPVA